MRSVEVLHVTYDWLGVMQLNGVSSPSEVKGDLSFRFMLLARLLSA